MKSFIRLMLLAVLMAAVAYAAWFARGQADRNRPLHQVLDSTAVLAQIRHLNRLESTSFHIDTVIKTQKQGNWYALWQDAQTGLFIARGSVVAGVDLNKLSRDNVDILDDRVIIKLPPVEILSVSLDNIEVYDMKTGSLNLHPADHSVLETVQTQAKQQVLASACEAKILEHAQTQVQQQLETLFALTQTKVSVYPAAVTVCKVN
ncbi:DUF4230 domain-containing protein [Neisseria weaveri]|uniref:DUF4230 domain-containing protein n=1 Tax=Neisseria weaveri TaxID=28091 RepID=UPI000D31B7EF|nr:DUF4230 domain-containing protein [Neisseria weaveri]